jgi:hypothetical protein
MDGSGCKNQLKAGLKIIAFYMTGGDNGALKRLVMKKLIFNLSLFLGFSLFSVGCDFDFTVDPPPSAWRHVSGILTERDSGNPISGMQVYAFECRIACPDTDEGCPDYASVKTKADGTFAFSYYGPSKFGFSHHVYSHPEYKHYAVNGTNRDNVLGNLCVEVGDSVFLDVKLW